MSRFCIQVFSLPKPDTKYLLGPLLHVPERQRHSLVNIIASTQVLDPLEFHLYLNFLHIYLGLVTIVVSMSHKFSCTAAVPIIDILAAATHTTSYSKDTLHVLEPLRICQFHTGNAPNFHRSFLYKTRVRVGDVPTCGLVLELFLPLGQVSVSRAFSMLLSS